MGASLAKLFQKFSKTVSEWMGHPSAFVLAVGVILVWALLGPMNQFSDTWQLVINTSTTIVTFLMVFLIQHTQNRDTKSLQLKLDELIRSTRDARNALIDLEDLSDEEIEKLHQEFCALKDHFEDKAEKVHEHRKKRKTKKQGHS